MTAPLPPIAEWRDVDAAVFAGEIVPREAPAVLRGLVESWPAVAAGRESADAARAYLAGFDRGAPVEAFVGPPGIGGRFFYADDMRGFNFERRTGALAEVLRFLATIEGQADSPAVYVGAAAIPDHLPGFAAANGLALLDGKPALPRLWFGNESVVSTHFDLSDNIACVVVGRRRFTLFPPDQLANLYVGPLDHTMAGQPASMVDLAAPDFAAFPRFRDALAVASSAELEPGDAIYVPAMWWHNVEALSPFNALVNFWWDETPPEAGSPFEALVHAILAVSHLPPARRRIWREMFAHYAFRPGDDDPLAHLAPAHRGILAPPTPALRERIRQFLLRGLSRR
jgi:hypothetical protein